MRSPSKISLASVIPLSRRTRVLCPSLQVLLPYSTPEWQTAPQHRWILSQFIAIMTSCRQLKHTLRLRSSSSTPGCRLSSAVTAACVDNGHRREVVPKSIFEVHMHRTGRRPAQRRNMCVSHLHIMSLVVRDVLSVWPLSFLIAEPPVRMLKTARSSFSSFSSESSELNRRRPLTRSSTTSH